MTRRFLPAVFMVALTAMPAAAQGLGPHPGMMGGPMDAMGPVIHMLQLVDLSDAQKQQIHSLFTQAMEGDETAPQIRAAEQQLHAALLADVQDLQAIDAIKASLNAAHAAELDRHIDLMVKVAQILTPAQREQLRKLHPPAPGETK